MIYSPTVPIGMGLYEQVKDNLDTGEYIAFGLFDENNIIDCVSIVEILSGRVLPEYPLKYHWLITVHRGDPQRSDYVDQAGKRFDINFTTCINTTTEEMEKLGYFKFYVVEVDQFIERKSTNQYLRLNTHYKTTTMETILPGVVPSNPLYRRFAPRPREFQTRRILYRQYMKDGMSRYPSPES
jgi:hypothetical protein